MGSKESSANSTRLSMDVVNLPLTPFGMRHQESPRKLTTLSTNRFNKLSRRKGRGLTQEKETIGYQSGNKKDIDSFNNYHNRKRWPLYEPKSSDLHSVPEDKILPESNCTLDTEESVHHKFNDFHMDVKLRHRQSSGVADSGGASSKSTERRDSVYTDIDDGSFIEFCNGNEMKNPMPCSADKTSKVPLYYTCQSDNDTQYSTSTKVNNALVGFHKYIDKIKVHMNLENVLEKSEINDGIQGKANINNLHDETVITCSADIKKFFRRNPYPVAANSTVIDSEPLEKKGLSPCFFSEISSLTDKVEISAAAHTHHQNKYPAKHQIVVISESSDDEKSQPIGGKSLAAVSHNFKITQPNGDNFNIESKPLCYENVNQHSAFPLRPSPAISATTKALEDESVISEDISIISRSPESRGITPQKSTREELTKTSGVYHVRRTVNKSPMIHENNNKTKTNTDDVGNICEVYPKTNTNEVSDNSNPVHRWIMSSPFKESSFNSSFLEQIEDSHISESPSQPKLECGKLSFQSAKKSNRKSSSSFCKLKKNSQSSSMKKQSPVAEEVVSSGGESSEFEFNGKRNAMKQRVIISSEESEDDKKGMYVTERRRKKYSVKTKSQHKNLNETLDSEEESLHLRLSKSQNETSIASERTMETIGKIAASPQIKIDNGARFESHQSPQNKRSIKTYNPSDDLESNYIYSDVLPPCNDIHNSTSKELLTPQKSGNDHSMDLSLIRKELDNLYTSEWRQNENAIFMTAPSDREEECRRNRSRKSLKKINKRRSKSCPRLSLEFDGEKSHGQRTRERSDDVNQSGEEECKITRNNILNSKGQRDEETVKMISHPLDSPLEDSFEEYLKKARVITQEKKRMQELKYSHENEDRYESSFINDDSSDESYFLPQIISPKKTNHTKICTKKINSVPKTKDKTTRKEKDISVSRGAERKNHIISDEDSFNEYLRKAKFRTKKKKKPLKKLHYSDDEDCYESSCITDDNSDDGSNSLHMVTQKPLRNPSKSPPFHNQKEDVLRKQDKGFIKPDNDPQVITNWRNSHTVILTSDSDDEICSLPDNKEKVNPSHSSHTTPHIKIKRKYLPKTVGHKQHLPLKNKYSQLSPRLSFLASLSSNINNIQCHPDALPYVRNFKKKKEELVEKLYNCYNTYIFDDKLPPSMSITWNARLTKTAGYCYYQINKSATCGRGSRIELSSKVIDCCERLRDTLIHELCHAAAWIISGYKDGHGPLWKAWATKARTVFPELPAINRCHNYQIQCKYTYRCMRCSYSIGRHSKSLDTNKKVCGHCFGKFELLVNSTTQRGKEKQFMGSEANHPPKTPKTPGPFALFVKENYKSVKKSTPNVKHGDVMRILSSKFEEMKTSGN